MPRLAELLRQMEQQRQAPASDVSPIPAEAPLLPPPPPSLELEKEEEERHHIHVELTSEQLQKLIDAVLPEVMSVKQLARYLQKGPGWVSDMARRGIIPATKMGNSWRFVRRTVDEWLLGRVSVSMRERREGDSNK